MAAAAPALSIRAVAALSPAEREAYERDGFHIARGIITPAEVEALRAHAMALHANSPVPDYVPEPDSTDPLKVYPRMMQPHRYDEVCRRQVLDPRIFAVLRDLLGEEPLAAQTMIYYKPPLADGQGWHQDNFYLRAAPCTCMAAWLALDESDAANGSLFVQRGSHRLPMLCPEKGEVTAWGGLIVPPPPEEVVEVAMAPGDCLFFNGSLVHGSERNASATRWRRSFISHYIGASATQVAGYYAPLLDAQGSLASRTYVSMEGSPC